MRKRKLLSASEFELLCRENLDKAIVYLDNNVHRIEEEQGSLILDLYNIVSHLCNERDREDELREQEQAAIQRQYS